jgi:hypothetical protein
MSALFGDFDQFSAEKIAIFCENQCYDEFFAKSSSILGQKRHFFSPFLGKNI